MEIKRLKRAKTQSLGLNLFKLQKAQTIARRSSLLGKTPEQKLRIDMEDHSIKEISESNDSEERDIEIEITQISDKGQNSVKENQSIVSNENKGENALSMLREKLELFKQTKIQTRKDYPKLAKPVNKQTNNIYNPGRTDLFIKKHNIMKQFQNILKAGNIKENKRNSEEEEEYPEFDINKYRKQETAYKESKNREYSVIGDLSSMPRLSATQKSLENTQTHNIFQERGMPSQTSYTVNYSKYFEDKEEFMKEIDKSKIHSQKFRQQKHNELVEGVKMLFKGCSENTILEVLGVILPNLSDVLGLYLKMTNCYKFLIKNLSGVLKPRIYNKWLKDPKIPPKLLTDLKNSLYSLDAVEDPLGEIEVIIVYIYIIYIIYIYIYNILYIHYTYYIYIYIYRGIFKKK